MLVFNGFEYREAIKPGLERNLEFVHTCTKNHLRMPFGYCIVGKFGELTCFEHLMINISANRTLIVSTNLDGFSLANHRRFTKLSHYTVCARSSSVRGFNIKAIAPCAGEVWSQETSSAGSVDGVRCHYSFIVQQ